MSYILLLMSLFAVDSIVKYGIEKEWIKKRETDGIVVLKKHHNRGAMLNICDKNQHFIAVLSLVFSAFVTGIFAATLGRKGKGVLKTGLALILGGAYSNTYDRLKRKYVVDYFSFHINTEKCTNKVLKKAAGKFGSIVFNLADFGIIIGAMLLVISELGGGQE